MRDANGEPSGFRGIIQDVPERKKAEEALRQSEERLKLAIDAGDLGFWDMNMKTQKGIINERWAEMLGYRLMKYGMFNLLGKKAFTLKTGSAF